MAKGDKELDARQSRNAGAHPHASDIPKFKRKRESVTPRYAPVLAIGWVVALFIAVFSFVRGITGWDVSWWNWHYVTDGLVWTALLVTISFLWEAWEREERYPELLPKREFERRYPPSSAAPPAPSRPPNDQLPIHRRVPYTEDVTQTGSVISQWNADHPDPMFQDGPFPQAGDDRCG